MSARPDCEREDITMTTDQTDHRADTTTKLLVMLGFQKSMDSRHPITTALLIKDDEGNSIVTVDLDEHQMLGLLSGTVIHAEGRVSLR